MCLGKERVTAKSVHQVFKDNLSTWYDILIQPLKSHLPLPDSKSTVTFIPDGELASSSFWNFLPSEMGNPEENLSHTEAEVLTVQSIMKDVFTNEKLLHVAIRQQATVDHVLKQAPDAKWIHFACHGVVGPKTRERSNSIFDGLFRLAPMPSLEKNQSSRALGQLRAKDVSQLTLKTDLVFMSACHLEGRGNVQKEGSIGPIWSFLGTGALSTTASYWPLPEDSDNGGYALLRKAAGPSSVKLKHCSRSLSKPFMKDLTICVNGERSFFQDSQSNLRALFLHVDEGEKEHQSFKL
ncbi:hypothetical protein ACTFIV_006931 [Dictyostelium citrinum]